jgi:class 3 adenylate cyclase/tetratricopeptide (TPR) repeat protein
MTFEELLDQAIDLLRRRGRLTYRTLKRQFGLDDAVLEDLKEELIYGQRLAVDEEERVLVWVGETTAAPPGSGGTPAHDPGLARTPLAYTPPHLVEKILISRSALEGERKQVTVLFADLKGSMELLAERDPEEARQLLDPVLERMMAAVHRYEGTVNQVMGDGIMALFGAPLAQEDHAVRACYAALAMQAAVQQYAAEVQRSHGVPLQMRVGLNAGEVVVRAIGNDLHMDYSAIGQTTHLAARMEQMAMPGSILMTSAVLGLTQGYVHVRGLGPVPVKGLDIPVEVYELVGASGVRRRLQAAQRGLTRFVGRDTELAALVQALEHADAGHGQVVAGVGEAGVGKSRLVYEFVHSHHTQGWRVLESASVSYGKATPYLPLLDLLRHYCHIEERDDPRTIRAKVTGQVLTLDEALQDTVPALLWLLEVLPDDSPFRSLDPPQRRQRLLDALKRVLLRESIEQPLLLVFEDLHWTDAESLAWLNTLIDSLPMARVLLLVNYRPEYQHGWGRKTYYTQLRLDPLPPASAEAVLDALLGDGMRGQHATSLQVLKQLLIVRTEGNPFFLEESVHTLVETGVLVGEPGAYRLAQPVDSLQVPATVQAVLAARIDRLSPEAKRLLQTAAVIGTEVPVPLLQAIADTPAEALQRSLAQLQAAEFLYETRLFPEHEYTFKHALTHEVAYGSLLLERRRVLHARIVAALEGLAGNRAAEQVERLGHHALRGEVWDKALAYCWQAGEKALARSAHREAVGYFESALSALTHLPESRHTLDQAIDLRIALRAALQPSGDWGRILAALHQAEELATSLGDHRRLGRLLLFLSIHVRQRSTYDQAIAAAQRALELATAGGEVVLGAMANQYLGAAHQARGDYRQAIDYCRQTVAVLAAEQRRERFGSVFLPAVQSRGHLVACHSELGMFAEGLLLGEEGLRIAEAVAHPGSVMIALHGLGLLALRRGDLPRALPLLERAVGLCQEADLPLYFHQLAAALGAAYTLGGRVTDAMSLLTQAMAQATAMERVDSQALCLLPLGEAHLAAGRLDEAHALTEGALAHARGHQERGHQAYALRLLGENHARRNPPDSESAAAYYRQALALADELGMRPLQAHCHLGLGTLYVQTGHPEPARAALTAAMGLYRAMDMTFWLPQAEAVLMQVEGR